MEQRAIYVDAREQRRLTILCHARAAGMIHWTIFGLLMRGATRLVVISRWLPGLKSIQSMLSSANRRESGEQQ